MGMVGDIMVRLGLNATEFQRGLKTAERNLKDVGEGFKTVGESMAKAVTLPMTALGTVALTGANDVQKSQGMIQAQLGTTGTHAKELQGVVTDLFNKGFGENMGDVEGAVTNVIQNMKSLKGASTENIASVAKDTMLVSEAFNQDGNEVTKAVNSMQQSFKGLDTTHAFDLITAGFQDGLDYSGEFLDSINEYGVQFANMGFSANDMFAVFKAGADSGAFQLDKVGDLVKELNLRLLDGSKSTSEAMGSLSGHTQELWKNFQKTGKGGSQVFQAIMKDLAGVTDESERNQLGVALMGTQFEDLQYKGVQALADVGGGLGFVDDRTKNLGDALHKNFGATLTQAFRQVQTSLAPIGETLAGLIQNYLPSLISMIQNVSTWFTSLSSTGQLVVVSLAGIVAVLPLIVIGIGSMITAIGSIVGAVSGAIGIMSKLGTAFKLAKTAMNLTSIVGFITSPLGLIIAGILAAIAVGVLIYKNWDTIKAKAIEIWGAISSFFSTVWSGIVSMATSIWSGFSSFFVDLWNGISETASSVWSGITSFFSSTWTSIVEGVTGFVDGMKQKFTDGWNAVKDVTTNAFNAVKDFLAKWGLTILTVITGPLGLFIAFIVKNWDTIKETTKIVFDMIKALIQVAFNVIKSIVSPIVSSIKDAVTTAWNGIKSVTSSVFSAVSSFISSVWSGIKGFITPIVQAIFSVISNVWNKIKSVTSSVFNSVKSVVSSVWNSIKSVVSSVASAIGSVVSKAWNKIKSTTSSVFNSIKSVVSSVWNSIKSVVTSVASAIWSVISSKFNQIKSTVTSIFNSVKSTATSIWNGIKSSISSISSSIHSTVSSAFNKIKSAMTKPIESAKSSIKGMLDKIKGFFSGLHLTIPKPKIPKVSVSAGHKSVAGVDVPYPKFSVAWNAKGNIFTGASLLGGGQGVGEAGAEVVMPIQRKRYMKPYASMVADLMDEKNNGGGGNTITNHFNISQMVIREEADIQKVATELERIQRKQQRAKGQFAF